MRRLVLATLLAAAALPAAAAPTLTTDAGAFATATAALGFTTETFDSLPAFQLLAATHDFGPFAATTTFFAFPTSGGAACVAGTCLGVVRNGTFTFDSPVSAISFAIQGHTSAYTLLVDGSHSLSLPAQPGAGTFFVGIYDLATPFTSFKLDVGFTGNSAIDNLSFAAPAANTATAPEPASLALLGAGLAGIAAARRRRQAWDTPSVTPQVSATR